MSKEYPFDCEICGPLKDRHDCPGHWEPEEITDKRNQLVMDFYNTNEGEQ